MSPRAQDDFNDDFTELYRAHGGRLVVQLYVYTQDGATWLYYLADMTVAEVAEIEGATENTVKQRLHRARAALADKLLESRPEVGHVSADRPPRGRVQ